MDRNTDALPSAVKGMTFVNLRDEGQLVLGIRAERGILNVERAKRRFGGQPPATTDDVVRGRGDLAALPRLLESALAAPDAGDLFVADGPAALGPCLADPQKIICIGLNYRRHAAESGMPVPQTPILFSKFNNALNHHGGQVRISRESAEQFDYEAELVVVIGRTARDVSEAEALDYVFGYCVGNDVSARDLQMRTTQWLIGKTNDGFAPIGPYLVTADQVPDPNALAIECAVNGEVRQSSNTRDMVFDCRQLVSYISRHMTLQPGDVIFTGTPEGVILGYPQDKRVWLKPGDRVTTRIERLGELQFTMA